MDRLEEELYYSVGYSLHEWNKGYQVNPYVSLDNFFEAFRDHGFKVNLDDKFKFAFF